jgi:hypothetical protein
MILLTPGVALVLELTNDHIPMWTSKTLPLIKPLVFIGLSIATSIATSTLFSLIGYILIAVLIVELDELPKLSLNLESMAPNF